MNQDTFTEIIIALLNRKPFRPFTLVLVSGTRYEVDYPNALAVRDGLVLFAAPGRVPVIFDNESVSHVIGDVPRRGADAS